MSMMYEKGKIIDEGDEVLEIGILST